jgi:hypothetical protein
MIMPFYMCRDVIDLPRIQRNANAKHLEVEADGEFEFKPDPARR